MNPTELRRLARANGIQTSYLDNLGRKQVVSNETLRLILDGLGMGATNSSSDPSAIRVIEPVVPCWQNSSRKVRITLPAKALRSSRLVLTLENGDREEMPLRRLAGVSTSHGVRGSLAQMQLDIPELPMGYHNLSVETYAGAFECLLISAPRKVHAEPHRQWGAFLPLYAARSERSWGAGNFSDWKELSRWIAAHGGKVMGTLPLLAAFLDQPRCEPSPYSPASRLFWNEFFIDITAIPEFQKSAEGRRMTNSGTFKRQLDALRKSELIDYQKEWAIRRRVLERLARQFYDSPRRKELDEFLRQRPEAYDYAAFRATCDRKKIGWRSWSSAERRGTLRDYANETRDFYLYIQWIAQQQIDDVLASCRAEDVRFYLDLPVGVNPDGYDAWRYTNFFAEGLNAGAPPDSFFTKGQDWGFAPLHPTRARELRYRYVIDYLRFQMRHTGLLRIDHVMGLHRLWCVPHGHPASAGAYISYPAEELYAILSLESHRHGTTLVGENLGTVPPEVNRGMDRHGLRRMFVLQYELQPGGAIRDPEPAIAASLNTHDMPGFAAYWKGLDTRDRFKLGLLSRDAVRAENRARENLRRGIVRFLRKKKLIARGKNSLRDVLQGVLKFLALSRAETVLVNLEDLWLEERPQNVPGTSIERPNWRRRSALTLEQMQKDSAISNLLKILERKI